MDGYFIEKVTFIKSLLMSFIYNSQFFLWTNRHRISLNFGKNMDTRVEMYWISQLSAHNCNEKPVVTLTTDEFVLNALKFLTLVNDILDTSVTKAVC